jgi:hypothetical protein
MHICRWAHQIWWVFTFLFNVPGIVVGVHQFASSTALFAYLALANLTVTILVRNELVLLFLYWSFKYIPIFKFPCHRMLHSIGGLHVGTGIATDVWIIVYAVRMFTRPFDRTWPEWTMRTTVVIIAIALTLMIATALSPIRRRHHNLWEYVHRYVGWFSLVNLTLHVIANAATLPPNPSAVFYTPLPYLTTVCLVSVFYVWFTVRKVSITTFVPHGAGSTVAIIKFPGRPTMKDGTVARVSTDCFQWHAFSIAMADGAKPNFGIIVCPLGDWTRSLVESVSLRDGPKKMWIRGVNPPGFMHMHRTIL